MATKGKHTEANPYELQVVGQSSIPVLQKDPECSLIATQSEDVVLANFQGKCSPKQWAEKLEEFDQAH